MLIRSKLYLFLVFITIASCNSSKKQVSFEKDTILMSTQWELSSWKEDNKALNITTLDTITILFDLQSKQISGSDGCNQFKGEYVIEKDELSVGKVGATKMYCGEESSIFERNFIEFLSKCKVESVSEKELILSNDRNKLFFNPK